MCEFEHNQAILFRKNHQYNELFKYCMEHCENDIAMTYLGYCYENGFGTEHNAYKAGEWYQKASDLGNATAMCNLGVCFENGTGVETDRNKAFRLYQQAATQGHVVAMFNLGLCYSQGIGVQRDDCMAAKWYNKAADLGDSQAMYLLGICFENGIGVDINVNKAYNEYKKSAKLGNIASMFNLGMCYENGIGIGKDAVKAAYWFQKSATNGDSRGMDSIGRYYYLGIGVSECKDLAYQWFKKSAELNNPAGLRNLGICYEKGAGVDKNEGKAYELYLKAANLGDINAMCNLGVCYGVGIGVEKNEYEAYKWLKRAANKNDPIAMYNLAFCYSVGYGIGKSEKEAFEWFKKASEFGNVVSICRLGICYENGFGVKKDVFEAVKCYQKAASQGNRAAMCNLGMCYYYGTGVKEDESISFKWFQRAADLGDATAMCFLGMIYENGIGAEEDQVKAVEWYKKAIISGSSSAMFRLGLCYKKGKGVNQDKYQAYEWINRAASLNCKEAVLYLEKSDNSDAQKEISAYENTIESLRKEIQTLTSELHSSDTDKRVMFMLDQIIQNTNQIPAIHKRMKNIQMQLQELTDYIVDDLAQSIKGAKTQLKENIRNLTDDKQIEQLTSECLDGISSTVNEHVGVSKDLVEEERKHLMDLFGSGWDKLLPSSQMSLISAGVLWKSCADISDNVGFDFSGICISATSALEAEVKRYFFLGFQQYLIQKYGKPNRYKWEETFAHWPDELLEMSMSELEAKRTLTGKAPFICLRDLTKVTLGNLPYLFGLYKPTDSPEKVKRLADSRDRLNEYLATITTGAGSTPIDLFVSTEKNSSFVERCDLVRQRYRNPAAHTDVVSKADAENCYQEVIGKIEAYRHTADVTSLLMELVSKLK